MRGNDNIRYKLDLILLTLPVIATTFIYFLDEELKKQLTLIPANFTYYQLYTTNFVHYSFGHIATNIALYLLFGISDSSIISKIRL